MKFAVVEEAKGQATGYFATTTYHRIGRVGGGIVVEGMVAVMPERLNMIGVVADIHDKEIHSHIDGLKEYFARIAVVVGLGVGKYVAAL